MPPMDFNKPTQGVKVMPTEQPDLFEVTELTAEQISKKSVPELRDILNSGSDKERMLAEMRLNEIAAAQREEDAIELRQTYRRVS
jgi:hypothetical protein